MSKHIRVRRFADALMTNRLRHGLVPIAAGDPIDAALALAWGLIEELTHASGRGNDSAGRKRFKQRTKRPGGCN